MIVVTGLPRSGTSLMMSILKDLGVPILGERFFENIEDERRAERTKYLNPEGFYEVRNVVGRGIVKGYEENVGKAIKIVVPGILHTDPEAIEKVIFCLRNPLEILNSQKKLISGIEIYTDDGLKYSSEVSKIICRSNGKEGDEDKEVTREFCFQCHQSYLMRKRRRI